MAQDFGVSISARECVGLFQGREFLDPAPGIVPLLTFTPPDECVIHCVARATAVGDAGQGAAFVQSATFSKFAGVVAQIGSTTALSTHRTDPSWDLALQLPGNGRLQLVAIPDTALYTRWTWRLECQFAPLEDPTIRPVAHALALPVF